MLHKERIKDCHYYQGEPYNPYCRMSELNHEEILLNNPKAYWWDVEYHILHIDDMEVHDAIMCTIYKHMEFFPGNEEEWLESYKKNAIK